MRVEADGAGHPGEADLDGVPAGRLVALRELDPVTDVLLTGAVGGPCAGPSPESVQKASAAVATPTKVLLIFMSAISP